MSLLGVRRVFYHMQCFHLPGVFLPTNYYFGASAATGDLSGQRFAQLSHITINNEAHIADNHDIVAMKASYAHADRRLLTYNSLQLYEIDYARAENQNANAGQILPSSDQQTAPRDHVVNPPASKLSTWGKVRVAAKCLCH